MRLWDTILERDIKLDDLMERTAEAVATGEPLMISQLSRQGRGRGSLGLLTHRLPSTNIV